MGTQENKHKKTTRTTNQTAWGGAGEIMEEMEASTEARTENKTAAYKEDASAKRNRCRRNTDARERRKISRIITSTKETTTDASNRNSKPATEKRADRRQKAKNN